MQWSYIRSICVSFRNIDERTSCQRLQILFSFSVPCHEALEHIMKLKVPIISAGAVSIRYYFTFSVMKLQNNTSYAGNSHRLTQLPRNSEWCLSENLRSVPNGG